MRLLAVARALTSIWLWSSLTPSSAKQDAGDKLVFLGSAGGVAAQIFTSNPDGTGVLQVTDDVRYRHSSASWSPDGERILFRRSVPFDSPIPDPEPGIFVIDADGKGLKQISDGNDRFPSWSPLGDRIAFMSYVQNSGFTSPDIFVADPTGGQPVNVSEHDASDERPTWSPDGKEVAFVRRDAIMDNRGEYEDIYDVLTVNPATLEVRAITEEPLGFIGWVRWSPDGSEIMYAGGTDPGESHIYYADADGGSTIRVDGVHQFPEYSPDGAKIAFAAVGGLHVMNHDGTDVRKVIDTSFGDSNFAWSPDGSKLIYTGRDDLVVVDVESGVERELHTGVRSSDDVDWYDATSPRTTGVSTPLYGSSENWHVPLFVGIGLLAAAALSAAFLRLRAN